jgi:hypothetical protein
MSMLLRVAGSKVRLPRSQITTRSFPAARIASAAAITSSTVAAIPRFRRMGSPEAAARSRSGQFCMFRAPIWTMSANSATAETSSGPMASVTTPSPSRSATRRMILRPSRPSPWKL